jgi:hypothetical protein
MLLASLAPIFTMVSAIGAAVSAYMAYRTAQVAARQVQASQEQVRELTEQNKLLSSQIQQANDQMLTTISNQQNWAFFERHADIPPVLPSWKKLAGAQDWAWRVIHLNHLNYLQLVWHSSRRKLMNQSEVDSWILKGRYWFQNVWQDSPEFHRGREILIDILGSEEGYPDEFRKWLVEKKVVSSDTVPDLHL